MTQKDLKLDMHSLDESWLEQPELSYKWGLKLIEAEMMKNRLKDVLEATKAEIDMEIRENVSPKPTESAINSMIILDQRYKRIMKQYFEADANTREIKNMVMAVEAKRKALEGLSELYVAGYFASRPMAPNPATQEKLDRVQEEHTEKLNKKISKRLKK